MDAFSWLLISDLHLKSSYTTWSQNVVLTDMRRDIENRRGNYPPIRFVIVGGDLAHGGKSEQYALVEAFLDSLLDMLSLERSSLFIVPGNHDVDRDIHHLAFQGARAIFKNAENVERILSLPHERQLLLDRLSAYHEFEKRVCPHLAADYTEDGLVYLSTIHIDALPIGIVGLNTAITCGDDEDERQLVVGDRPMIDICEKIRTSDVRLIVGVMHHPPEWLTGFDKRTFERRLLPKCDILHRGHLHEPDVTPLITAQETKCLVIASGASYAWRQFTNSYSIITLDVATARCVAKCFEYENHAGTFHESDSHSHAIVLRGDLPGNLSDFADALRDLNDETAEIASYLTALLNNKTHDIPIPLNGGVHFAAPDLLSEADDPIFVTTATEFLHVRNSLLAFPTATPLDQRVRINRDPISRFAIHLKRLADNNESFRMQIKQREELASALCGFGQRRPENNYIATLAQFAAEQDWVGLEQLARRYLNIADPIVGKASRTHLSLALAHSDEVEKKQESLRIVNEVLSEQDATVSDFELAFMIRQRLGQDDSAEQVIRDAIDRFATLPVSFMTRAYRLVATNGKPNLKAILDGLKGDGHE